MPLIHLTTEINAPIQVVFDLARSIDFHEKTASKSREKAVGGRTSGLIELGETVVWEAVHFGIKQKLSTKITAMNAPKSFKDEMVFGAFKSIKHDHAFISAPVDKTALKENKGDKTIMIDFFHFESPYGLVGKMFNNLVLTNYMKRFLKERNAAIKKEAERIALIKNKK